MLKALTRMAGLAAVIVFAISGAAQADTTLGSASQPSGSDENGCSTDGVIAQVTSDPGTPYSVPGPGTITQWQTNVSLSDVGDPVTLLVLKPVGSSFTVVGVDTRSIPAQGPGTIATFPLGSPLPVSGGETFGLYTNQEAGVVCYFDGGTTPLGDTLAGLEETSPPAPNQTLNRDGEDSPGGFTMNLAANFAPTPTPPAKKKCKKHKKKHSAESAKKKKCKKKKK
jgi:hypothetical protein